MSEIRILTVRQPWAWAIIHGGKDVENRARNIAGDYRGTVAIHAGLAAYEQGNLGATAHRAAHGTEVDTGMHFGAIIGTVELEEVHISPSCYFEGAVGEGRYCSRWAEDNAHHLVLANPRPLAKPIPFTGALGLRKFDPEILEGKTN